MGSTTWARRKTCLDFLRFIFYLDFFSLFFVILSLAWIRLCLGSFNFLHEVLPFIIFTQWKRRLFVSQWLVLGLFSTSYFNTDINSSSSCHSEIHAALVRDGKTPCGALERADNNVHH
jgi:hypothetical protein